MDEEVISIGSNSSYDEVEVVQHNPIVQEVQSDEEGQEQEPVDVQVIDVIQRRPALNLGRNSDDEVEILGSQRATVRFTDNPLFLPTGVAFTHEVRHHGITANNSRRRNNGNYDDGDESYEENEFEDNFSVEFPIFRQYQLGFRSTLRGVFDNAMFRMRTFGESLNEQEDIADEFMRQVDRMENENLEHKFETQKEYSRQYIEKAEAAIKDLPPGYSSGLDKSVSVICPLCGVELGKGIPEELAGRRKTVPEDEESENESGKDTSTASAVGISDESIKNEDTYRELIQRYGCQAPYQLLPAITKGDIDLSKKTYFAKCGHVYCGRCVQKIVTKVKKRVKMPKNIYNPSVYAPNKCVAEGCKKLLVGGRFVEIYNG